MLWKGEGKRKGKVGFLCLILKTYIMLTLRVGGQMVAALTRNIKSYVKPSCPPDTTLQMPRGQDSELTNAHKSLRLCH